MYNNLSLSQNLRLISPYHMLKQPQPPLPQHSAQLALAPHLPASSKLLTRSLQVTPAIHLSIFLSQPSNILVSLPVSVHVSPP